MSEDIVEYRTPAFQLTEAGVHRKLSMSRCITNRRRFRYEQEKFMPVNRYSSIFLSDYDGIC